MALQVAAYVVGAIIITTILEGIMIPFLTRLKIEQTERDDGPRMHKRKQGTPTMGGAVMMDVLLLFMIIFFIFNRKNGVALEKVLALGLTGIGFGIVGFVDDFKKIIKHNTEGLNPKLKMIGLYLISCLFIGYLVFVHKIDTAIEIPLLKTYFSLPRWIYFIFSVVVLLAVTNAVNLTDGVDGLNGCVSGIILIGLAIIAFRRGQFEIGLMLLTMAGSCLGFLRYNFHPAKVFMGDTGSLFLGGIIGVAAIYMQIPLLLLVIAIVPVIETLSVILQVLSVQLRKKRLFKMSPLHHHLELSGWRENRVVVLFSIITIIASTISIFII